MRFVIIGGDAAGMSAASRAKRNAPDLDVVVFEQTQDVSYSACGMPYTIADPHRQLDELVVRRAEVFRQKQGIDLRTGHRVEAIDPRAKQVRGKTIEKHQRVIARMTTFRIWLRKRFRLEFEFLVPKLVRLTKRTSSRT
jgi:NADPH-dependent 2,4-dienoyl-CoA reductase/sulfur reductase-like enzyme